MVDDWVIQVHKEVLKKHIPLLESAGQKNDYEDIVEILRKNPYENIRSREKLNPRNKQIFSMRVNSKHRVVCTINKEAHTIKIWSAWSHYENRVPK